MAERKQADGRSGWTTPKRRIATKNICFIRRSLAPGRSITAGKASPTATPEYIERIQNYMNKALNEAKINTSWVQPNDAWLSATNDFVAKLLESHPKNKFLPAFLPMVEEIARLGAINSLSQTLLKFDVARRAGYLPGERDLGFFAGRSDNRRPVDFKLRRAMLESLGKARPEELLESWPDGRIKMFLTQRVLRFRRDQPELFAEEITCR